MPQSWSDVFDIYDDITVAGHLSAGETPREAVREIEEEIGLEQEESRDYTNPTPAG